MRISDWSSDVCSSDLVEIGVIGLGPDRGRVEKQFGAHQRHRARGFGIPLIPAYPDADPRSEDVPYLEAGVAGPEIIFLFIARPVGNVALAIRQIGRASCRERVCQYV